VVALGAGAEECDEFGERAGEEVDAIGVIVQEEEEARESGVEDDDVEPLPPGRRHRTSGVGEERRQSSTGSQRQGRVPSSFGRPNLSSEDSRDSDPRGPSSWTLGGTQVQRRVTSSLGRRSRNDLSSEASRDSNSRDKRLRLESSVVPSSPPTTPGTISRTSDAPSGSSGKPVSRRFCKREFIPSRNLMVFDCAKMLLQGEILACHPWPNASTVESLVRRSWTNAIGIRVQEKKKFYPGAGLAADELPPTQEPDDYSTEQVSAFYL
jgi:hypothetical protein